jgi:hypothetical protein
MVSGARGIATVGSRAVAPGTCCTDAARRGRTKREERWSPMDAYALIRQAIQERHAIEAEWGGFQRLLIPLVLGRGDGERRLVAYQYGGESMSRLASGGQLRNIPVNELSRIVALPDEWQDVPPPREPQRYVNTVDVFVPGHGPGGATNTKAAGASSGQASAASSGARGS